MYLQRLRILASELQRETQPDRRLTILVEQSTLLARMTRIEPAARSCEAAEELVRATPLPRREPDVLYARATLHYFTGRIDEAVALLEQARTQAGLHERNDYAARCDSLLALFLVRVGAFDRGAAGALRALRDGLPADALTRYQAQLALGTAYAEVDEYELAEAGFAQARQAALTLRDDVALGAVLHRLAHLQLARYQRQARTAAPAAAAVRNTMLDIEAAARLAQNAGVTLALAYQELELAQLRRLCGCATDSLQPLAHALAAPPAALDPIDRAHCEALLAEAQLLNGQTEAARASVTSALAHAPRRAVPAAVLLHELAADVLAALDDGAQAADQRALARELAQTVDDERDKARASVRAATRGEA